MDFNLDQSDFISNLENRYLKKVEKLLEKFHTLKVFVHKTLLVKVIYCFKTNMETAY